VPVCPGLLGGVETPLAVSGSRVFVPVVDLCYREDATGGAAQSFGRVDPSSGRGRLVALDLEHGTKLWEVRLPSPPFGCATASDDLVFTSTFDGSLYAFSAAGGRLLWHARAGAGINACPAVSGRTLFVGAGVPRRGHDPLELVAYAIAG
jgi:outer membrane protein assembly factor BamB